MPITREELHQIYLSEKENEKKEIIKAHVEKIKLAVLRENCIGKTAYITSFINYYPEYVDNVINQLKDFFIDCDITITHKNTYNKTTFTSIKIDWKNE
jgi:hypothetical protein